MYRRCKKSKIKTVAAAAAFFLFWLLADRAHAEGSIAVDAAHFPDPVFREYVQDYLAEEDGVLTQAERDSVIYLEFYYEGLKNLQGIEYFPNLQYLYCEGNALTSLDLRKMSSLREVECTDNGLKSLNVSGLQNLTKLICSENQLSALPLTNLPALQELECSGNLLTSLNVRSLGSLQYLVCSSNRLQKLDLSGMKGLLNVDCEGNEMTSLTLGNLPALTTLLCGTNRLSSLDISGAPGLRVLYCYQNKLKKLDCTDNEQLQELEAFSNKLTQLNVAGVKSLVSINCSENQLSVLDVSDAAGLVNLIADNNRLSAIDLSKNKKLKQTSFIGQTPSTTVTQNKNGFLVDLRDSGYKKGRIKKLSSGKAVKKGIFWAKLENVPIKGTVTYTCKTGRKGITFPVELKLTRIKKWSPKPGKVNLYRAVNTKGKKISLKWKKVPEADGYCICYSTSAKFKGAKILWVKKGGKKSATVKKLKKKTYYVKVRAYTVYKGKKYYGAYSAKKKVKVIK